MKHYVAHVETARRGNPSAQEVDQLMEALEAFHPSISVSPYGYLAFTLTVPADGITQASTMALAVVEHATGVEAITIELAAEDVSDERQGFASVPELIGVPEAAELLSVTPVRVRQMIAEGKLSAHRIGERGLALVRSEVDAKANARR